MPRRAHEDDAECLMRKFLTSPSLRALTACAAFAARRPGRSRCAASLVVRRPVRHYDRAQLQRGFQVYSEVCAPCHSPEVRCLPQSRAARRTGLQRSAGASARRRVPDHRRAGRHRRDVPAAGTAVGYFPPPAPNDQALRARFGGALPPDLSVITKARGYESGLFGRIAPISSASTRSTAPITCTRCSSATRTRRSDGSSRPGNSGTSIFPGHSIAMCRRSATASSTIPTASPKTAGSICARRVGVPGLGGGAAPRDAQAHRLPGDDLPDRVRRADLLHQEEDLGRSRKGHADGAPAPRPLSFPFLAASRSCSRLAVDCRLVGTRKRPFPSSPASASSFRAGCASGPLPSCPPLMQRGGTDSS